MTQSLRDNPGRLELELLCRGVRLDPSCALKQDTRPVRRTRGGLGSGLDAVLTGGVWVNIPCVEPFVADSPFVLRKRAGGYELLRLGEPLARVTLPPRPAWYALTTESGQRVERIGVMQGTYFAVHAAERCRFWEPGEDRACRFCSVGLNLGRSESEDKSVQDVVEATVLARRHEGISFAHFNTGTLAGGERIEAVLPFVRAVKRQVGVLVGVQCPPAQDLSLYDELRAAGADHLSLCFEIFDPDRFARVCPGKAAHFGDVAARLEGEPLLEWVRSPAAGRLGDAEPHPGQPPFYRAVAYAAARFGRGQVSGEIVAGLESAARSIQAVELMASMGAVTTVCVFRPCLGTPLEDAPSPTPDAVAPVLARMAEVCVEEGIPVGIAPNIRTAMVHLPLEGRWLSVRWPAGRALLAAALRLALRGLLVAKLAVDIALASARRARERAPG